MDPATYLTPRIGLRTGTVMVCWLLVVSWAAVRFSGWSFAAQVALIGTFYGMIGSVCWQLTLLDRLLYRSIARLAILLVGSSVACLISGESRWVEFVIYFGGMMIMQSAIFFLVGLPAWQRDRADTSIGKRQFSIGEIMVGTTGIAMLLGLAIHFQPPIEARHYWQVLGGIWIWFPLIATCGCIAALTRKFSQSIFFLLAALLLTIVGCTALGYFDQRYNESDLMDNWERAWLYGMVGMGYLGTSLAICVAGRLDSNRMAIDANDIPNA